ncbi:MAG: hypothetical protein AVO33_03165 [delta proteobacterium ML8_F1]|nr:MAG: hypothetical protein AVO33_03165 [delta proteobacterium ML8_F1]
MNITLPVTLVLALMVIMSVMVLVFDYFTYLNQNIEMIYVMRPYLYHLGDRGELTPQQLQIIEERLENIGLEAVEIDILGSGGFGGKMTVEVTGRGESSRLAGFLRRENKALDYHYRREVIITRISN